MEGLHRKASIVVKDSEDVIIVSRQGTSHSVMKIDNNGNPNYVTHYTAMGGLTIIPENESFGSAVQFVMKSVLKEDAENFSFLYEHLNKEWKNLAEKVRKTA